jgi:hypothetical protein
MRSELAVSPAYGGELRTDARIAHIAGRQHGVVARRQLIAEGLSQRAVDRRIALGRLHPIHRGVFAVGHPIVSREGRWMAAVLAAGDGAVLSHQSAAALRGIRPTARERIDVTTPKRMHAPAGIQMHRAILAADEVTVFNAIPVTTPARTVFDLAATLTKRQVERAVNEAERLRLPISLDRYRSTVLREIAEDRRDDYTRSELEERFLAVLDARGLPAPRSTPRSNSRAASGSRRTASGDHGGLIVELDGYESHSTREAFERDREGDWRLQAEGWRVVRLTWRQLNTSAVEELLSGLGV